MGPHQFIQHFFKNFTDGRGGAERGDIQEKLNNLISIAQKQTLLSELVRE